MNQVSASMEGDGVEKEEMLFDLRRLNPKIHAMVGAASSKYLCEAACVHA